MVGLRKDAAIKVRNYNFIRIKLESVENIQSRWLDILIYTSRVVYASRNIYTTKMEFPYSFYLSYEVIIKIINIWQ